MSLLGLRKLRKNYWIKQFIDILHCQAEVSAVRAINVFALWLTSIAVGLLYKQHPVESD